MVSLGALPLEGLLLAQAEVTRTMHERKPARVRCMRASLSSSNPPSQLLYRANDLSGMAGAVSRLSSHPGYLANAIRNDLDALVLDAQTESDVTSVLNSVAVRQPDSDRFRLWEVTGTAHADAHLIGVIADTVNCGVPINNGPMHVVAKAALRALDSWVREGTAPVIAPRIEVTDDAATAIARDSDGIALGGIRTPPVDVPVDVLSGVPGPSTDLLCILLGSTTPLSDARLAELYPNRAAYQDKYATATDEAIKAGFVLEPDREALLGFAQPERIKP